MPAVEKEYETHLFRRGKSPAGMEEDDVSITMRFVKLRGRLSSPAAPVIYEDGGDMVADASVCVDFCTIKQKRYESYYKQQIAVYLSTMGVPEFYHPGVFEILFKELEGAVSRDPPIVMVILEVDLRIDTRTARSAIEGLESVRLDRAVMEHTPSCAICWVDFVQQDVDQLMLTRMPCSHYFHGDCIRPWLHINHLCPMCRYPMPLEEVAWLLCNAQAKGGDNLDYSPQPHISSSMASPKATMLCVPYKCGRIRLSPSSGCFQLLNMAHNG